MTGNCYADYVIVAVVGLLGFVGRHYGIAWVTNLGEWLSQLKRPEKQPASPVESKPIEQPAAVLRADAQEVAGPAWLSILLPFVSTLVPLILDLIAKFRAQNGREPTRLEVRQIIQAAHQAAEDGRVHAVLLDDPMPERDLEQVTAGKGMVSRANRALDSIDAAARDLGTAARSGDDLFRQGSRFLGS